MRCIELRTSPVRDSIVQISISKSGFSDGDSLFIGGLRTSNIDASVSPTAKDNFSTRRLIVIVVHFELDQVKYLKQVVWKTEVMENSIVWKTVIN